MPETYPNIQYYITTYNPLPSLPRFVEYFHRTASSSAYYSDGYTRAAQRKCIFQYTVSGCGETWNNGQYYRVEPGCGFLNIVDCINSGYRYSPEFTERWEFITFVYEYGNVRDIIGDLINTYGPVYDISQKSNLLMHMAEEIESRPEHIYTQSEVNKYFFLLINELLESVTKLMQPVSGLINDIHEIIRRRITNNISVKEIAYDLNISREHLSKLYKKYTGKTLQSYIIEQQVLYISRLLSDPSNKVTDIARIMNIDYPANLVSFFRKNTGMTPMQYRNLNK